MLLTLVLIGGLLAVPQPVAAATPQPKVAIIVGPVGAELTPVYLQIAEAAATTAEAAGALVARAYSPHADPDHVLAAVKDANIVVYLGHGVGVPNPYGAHPDPERVNGWGLQGPHARGDHSDSWRDGTLKYYGEAWIARHAKPAPGWVMIYSNACYAAGAGESQQAPATHEQAVSRLASYSRAPLEEMGASAVFATDFFESAAQLVGAILEHPDLSFGAIYASETRYRRDAVTALADPLVDGATLLLQRSAYFRGKVDYWYSFAGNPQARPLTTPAASGPPAPRLGTATSPTVAFGSAIPPSGIVTGIASSYGAQPGWGAAPTVALPIAYGGRPSPDDPQWITVCGDRCVPLPVVDSCPCYYGTADARIANLSESAWALVSDAPLAEGLIPVTLRLRDQPSPPARFTPTAPLPY
ncbi:MAG TPA: hypothetical protein VFM74_01845 [Candidatus Limnocylindria bacterium]|nr:hypothetical protein [Candidatus Limnocylindria bacterium]